MDASIEIRDALVLLSVRLSRKVFSPLTAFVLARLPDWLSPEVADSGKAPALSTLDVSACEWPSGDDCHRGVRLLDESVSTQSAGVGGTGPRAATPLGGGLRVGGDATGSLVLGLLTLWEREALGGGPGGGGGNGIPGPHLLCDADRDRADVGVSRAPVDAALRAPGGSPWEESLPVLCGIG